MIKKHKVPNELHSDSGFWNFRILGLFGSEFVSNFVLRISDFALLKFWRDQFSRSHPDYHLNGKNLSCRQPANDTDLPAGLAALAPVGVKILGGAARAGADLKQLLAGHAGFAQNIAIEPA